MNNLIEVRIPIVRVPQSIPGTPDMLTPATPIDHARVAHIEVSDTEYIVHYYETIKKPRLIVRFFRWLRNLI